MTELTEGQRSWMSTHIAEGLRTLGVEITPRSVERELQQMDKMLRAASDYAPVDLYEMPLARLRAATEAPSTEMHYDAGGIPDPYYNGIAALRARDAATHSRTLAAPTKLPLDANGIPDAYAAGLAALKEHQS